MLNHWIGKIFGRALGCPCHEELFDFALDGVEGAQRDKVRRHLADCPPCREQVKDYAWVSEGIALTAPQVDPPGHLCDKVKERIRAETQAKPLISESRAPGRDPLAGWPRFWMRLGPVFAVSSLLMTMLAFALAFGRSGRSSTPPELKSAAELLSSPSTRQVALSGEGEAAGSQGLLYLSPGQNDAVVEVSHLKPCKRGRVYTLWACPHGGHPRRMAGFQTEEGRDGAYLLHLAGPVEAQATDFQVTLEDSGKDPQLQQGPVRLRGHSNL